MAEMGVMEDVMRVPEARYAYYRRCQVFRRGDAQCKAPAEKGSLICYAHAGQLATAVRRERERRAVLEEAVAQMRKRGRPDCKMADLFMDLKGVNMTVAVMAQALIDGRIDCKTAGRLVVQLQTVSKLLRMMQSKGREGRKESRISPQIYTSRPSRNQKETSTTETRRHGEKLKKQQSKVKVKTLTRRTQRDFGGHGKLEKIGMGRLEGENSSRHGTNLIVSSTDKRGANRPDERTILTTEARRRGEVQKTLPLINTDNTDPRKTGEKPRAERDRTASGCEQTRIALVAKVLSVAKTRGWAHAPPELLSAA